MNKKTVLNMVIRIFFVSFLYHCWMFQATKKESIDNNFGGYEVHRNILRHFEEHLWCNGLLYTGQVFFKETSSIFLHEHIIIICQCHITEKTDMENVYIQMLAVSGTSQQVVTCKLSVVLRCTTSWNCCLPLKFSSFILLVML